MCRLTVRVLTIAAFSFSAAAVAQEQQEYRVSSWPGGIRELPCSALHRNEDGSWALTAKVRSGGLIFNPNSVTFNGNTGEAAIMQDHCGGKSRQ